MIWYKKAEAYGAVGNFFGTTTRLLHDIDLMAVVGGREVINPLIVKEVYGKENSEWKIKSRTFSHLAWPVKLARGTTPPPQS